LLIQFTILFADDQTIFSKSEDNLHRAVNISENTANGFNTRISTMKTKAMVFQGKHHIQCKIVIDNKTTEQVSSVNYFSFNTSYCLNENINNKVSKFQRMCGMIQRTLKQKMLQSAKY
jgi:hypothetical protein